MIYYLWYNFKITIINVISRSTANSINKYKPDTPIFGLTYFCYNTIQGQLSRVARRLYCFDNCSERF